MYYFVAITSHVFFFKDSKSKDADTWTKLC